MTPEAQPLVDQTNKCQVPTHIAVSSHQSADTVALQPEHTFPVIGYGIMDPLSDGDYEPSQAIGVSPNAVQSLRPSRQAALTGQNAAAL